MMVNDDSWTLATDDGSRALAFDSMLDISVANGAEIVTAPIEEGGFAAYNKAAGPRDIRVTLASQASLPEQQAVLECLDDLVEKTTLVTLITPSQAYFSLNLQSYDYRRTGRDGATLLVVQLSLREVRQVKTQVYSARRLSAAQCRNPASAGKVDRGQVQTNSTSYDVFH